MSQHRHVCPWWIGTLLASPLRRLLHDPAAILRPFVAEGMTVLEPGPGMGFFTLELARQVGASGRVVAIDAQPRMLEGLGRRARAAGLDGRIELRRASPEGLGIDDLRDAVDFVLAFYVVHELPSAARFFAEARAVLRPGGGLLLVEPRGHVRADAFRACVEAARAAGLRPEIGPPVRHSRTAVLVKEPQA